MIISESLNVGELCLHQQSTLTFLQVFLTFLKYLASWLNCSADNHLPYMTYLLIYCLNVILRLGNI